jgi:lipopolysaccharide biosynthesis glycosyltransferase
MNILYSFDNNFADIAGVSIISLLENNKSIDAIHAYILNNGIYEENIKRLQEIISSYGRDLTFLAPANIRNLVRADINLGRWGLSNVNRLFMGSVLPKDIDRVICIDCDTIVRYSLQNLWNKQLGDNYIAGVNDCIGKKYKISLDLDANSNYINAGVILVDVKRFRENNVENKFLELINKRHGNFTYLDQDILNGALGGQILALDPKFNALTVFFDFDYENMLRYRKPYSYYSAAEINEAKGDPVIAHFTTSFLSLRPWVQGCNHPFVKEFLYYKALTPWKNTVLKSDRRSKIRKIYSNLYNKLPLPIAVRVSSLLHSTLVPFCYELKLKLSR